MFVVSAPARSVGFGIGVWIAVVLVWSSLRTADLLAATVRPGETTASVGRLRGTVSWESHGLAGAVIYLYRDPTLRDLHRAYPLLSDSGRFDLRVEPGHYYVVATIDRNWSASFDEGDALGVHGILDWSDLDQRKRGVTVSAGATTSDVHIRIAAMRRSVGGESTVAELDGRIDEADATLAATATMAGSVRLSSGAEVAPDTPLHVVAYVQLARKRWVGQSRLVGDGAFELTVPPGAYYVAAVADRNGSNVVDAGDLIGFHGVTSITDGNLATVPAVVKVTAGDQRDALDIPLVARVTGSGRLVGFSGPVSDEPAIHGPVDLAGRVVWAGPLPATVVELYGDASLAQSMASTIADPSGRFRFSVPPGDYYITASVDRDGDGRVSPGDGVGAYGSEDVNTVPPKPYRAGAASPALVVRVTATYERSGQLAAIQSVSAQSSPDATLADSPGISGRISWDGRSYRDAWLLVSADKAFSEPEAIRVVLDAGGNYSVPARPGEHYVMAIVDATGDGMSGPGDGVAVYGSRDPLMGQPTAVRVFAGRSTPYINLRVSSLMTEGGGWIPLDDGTRGIVRRTYGEPDDRYRRTEGDRVLEEWWYWTQGVAFTYVADGPTWALDDTYQFTPDLKALEELRPTDLATRLRPTGQIGLTAAVYYGADEMIWMLRPDGSQAAVAYGSKPMATQNGIAFLDPDHDVVLVDAATEQTTVIVPGAAGFQHVVLSDDGRMLALVRGGDLHLRSMSGASELAVPLGMDAVHAVSWHQAFGLVVLAGIARADGPTSDSRPPHRDGDLFVYDPSENRLEPILADEGDDVDVACSPTDSRQVAFTRQDATGAQIWLLTLSDAGENATRGLTEHGGEQPAWLPDGSGLVYVVNGQLWTLQIDAGAESARPLMVAGEPILGVEPATHPYAP